MSEVSEGIIIMALNSLFIGNSKFKVPNIYVFKHDWESDFFVQKQNGYSYEFEVKISRSDFFNDFKKTAKHSILKESKYEDVFTDYAKNDLGNYEKVLKKEIKNWTKKPNKFFYVVPENLISVNEIPEYAGLYYFKNGSLTKIKDAPFLHKEKLKFENDLCHKFYNYWMGLKHETYVRDMEIERLKNENKKLLNELGFVTI